MSTLSSVTSSTVGPRSILTAAGALASLLFLSAGGQVAAHTETDVVAVPATEQATIRLAPTHGCGDAPTVGVRTRISIPGAAAQPVDGWTETSTADDAGHVVLEWTGGLLPADQAGAFPVVFTTPDTVGQLLTFPFIQTCANGEELAWIDGDPASEYPAPRVLVLPAGSPPAATIDDVPADAAGRDLLTSIADVDNPAATTVAPTTTTPPTAPAASTSVAVTAPPSTTAASDPPPTTELPSTGPDSTAPVSAAATSAPEIGDADGDDGGSGTTVALIVAALVVVGSAAIGAIAWRRRPTPT